MWINLLTITALVFVLLIGFVGYASAKNTKPEVSNQNTINKQLAKLEDVTVMSQNEMSAMCYEMSYTPLREEYSCPICHEITYYPSIPDIDSSVTYDPEIFKKIFSYRYKVKNIKKINVKLDESEFCKKCNAKIKNPKLYLIVNYSDKAKDHKVSNFTGEDLVLLYEFSEGKKVHRSNKVPLKKYEKRLKELLGVEVNVD